MYYVQYNHFSKCVVYDANFQPIETGRLDELFKKYNLRPVSGVECITNVKGGIVVPCEVYNKPVQFVVERNIETAYDIMFNPPLDRGDTTVK